LPAAAGARASRGALPPLLLGVAIARGGLTYVALIAYALAVGTAGAFVMPARDAMLTHVAAGGSAARWR